MRRYLLNKFGDNLEFKHEFGSASDSHVIDQLRSMGINTPAQFEKLIPVDFKERYRRIQPSKYGTCATGLVVWFLIIHDRKKYFATAYKGSYDS